MRPANFDHLAETLRNWGRWGPEDQRGTLNHIGPETLKAAAATVQSGKLFNLGLNFDKNGPQTGGGSRFNPKLYPIELFTPQLPRVISLEATVASREPEVRVAPREGCQGLAHHRAEGVVIV